MPLTALTAWELLREELRLNLREVVCEPHLPGQFYHVCTPAKRPSSTATLAVKNWLLAWR